MTATPASSCSRPTASSDYVTFCRLTSQGRSALRLPEAVRERPERMLEERFTQLAADGEIRTADPRRAVQHSTALTVLLAVDALRDDGEESAAAESEILAIIADGVDAFLRAYG
ncbi:TetR/AcrR family transcriptional regulator C-terminal domain-containing protein [Streptomyces sp. NBC_00444]|uniref:TetR/AcrR family transcriptional regulator C-terminal domain-containing protein n=2 Tax=unclassified Streptomyces TaxID=2593676 RepID=UPI002E1B5CAB